MAAAFARRIWRRLSDSDKTVVVRNGSASLDFTQDPEPPVVLCALLLARVAGCAQRSGGVCEAKLTRLARSALERKRKRCQRGTA